MVVWVRARLAFVPAGRFAWAAGAGRKCGAGKKRLKPRAIWRSLRRTAAGRPRATQSVKPFQIIFNPTSAGELSRMPKELQLQILGEFRGLPQQVSTELDQFGELERGGRLLHRFRVGDYRVYFERHELELASHRCRTTPTSLRTAAKTHS